LIEHLCDRIQASGSAGKLEIGAFTAWKRLRADTPWMAQLMALPDTVVREHTGQVVAAANNGDFDVMKAGARACLALEPLPGFRSGGALATAVCHAAAPQVLAVMDKRAIAGLRVVGLSLPSARGRTPYLCYSNLIEQCRRELSDFAHIWSARQVDSALFQLGKR
jgi:hypothetical protein